MEHATTVLIADSAEDFCNALAAALQRSEGFQGVGTAADGEQAIRLIAERKPDVLVLDFDAQQTGWHQRPEGHFRNGAPAGDPGYLGVSDGICVFYGGEPGGSVPDAEAL